MEGLGHESRDFFGPKKGSLIVKNKVNHYISMRIKERKAGTTVPDVGGGELVGEDVENIPAHLQAPFGFGRYQPPVNADGKVLQ